MSLDALIQALPGPQQKHLSPDAPLPARMMAAKGLAPLPPREMVIVLCGLTLDADDKLSASATESLGKLPDKLLVPALSSDLPDVALGILVRGLYSRPEVAEPLFLNRRTPDADLAAVSSLVTAELGEILIGNQERCLRHPPLVEGLRHNPNILRSSKDRLFDFLVRSGVIHDEMIEFQEAFSRLSSEEVQEMSERVSLPQEVLALTQEGGTVTEEDLTGDEDAEEELEELDLEMEQTKEGNEAYKELVEEDKAKMPMLQLINGLNTAQKIALAMKGNKEARSILIRDTNRMVSSSAVRSPRITEQEVVSAAQSRQIADDVIRYIANSRELSRSYSVKVALAKNPKTPQVTAMKLLTLLRQSELKAIAKSKNVSTAVSAQAKRILQRKVGGAK